MVPWPVALLTLFYGVLAAASAATVWKIATGMVTRPIGWPLAWLALCGAVMCGLPLLRSWARRMAILASALLAVVTVATAGLIVMAGRPLAALLATLSATVHIVTIRYLQRPAVKAYFH